MKNLLRFLMFSLVIFGCNKEDDLSPGEGAYKPPVIKVQGSIAGQVVNENGQGIKDVVVHVGTEQKTTGPEGYFQFRDIDLDANGTFIYVDEVGYFQASRRFFPKASTMNYTTLTLIKEGTPHQVDARTGGAVNLTGGASLQLPANGVANSDGSLYTSAVEVTTRWVSAADDNFNRLMPGNLQGISEGEEEVALVSYGMMAVELTNQFGVKLQLADGAKAQLSIPIPAALLSGAPSEIPLWHFDEKDGLWREEGFAVKQGEAYVGEVSHFSFWSWNIPLPFVNIEGRLVDPNGNPFANTEILLRVRLTGIPLMITGVGFTDENGGFSGKVPANESIQLFAVDVCGRGFEVEDLGTFSDDVNLGNFTIANSVAPNNGYTTITGTLVNCDNTPIATGVIRIKVGSNYIFVYPESDGSFKTSFLHCGNIAVDEVTIAALDLETELQSTQQTLPIAQNMDLGNYAACVSQLDTYIRLTVNGEERLYFFPYYFGGQPGAIMTLGGYAIQDSSYALRLAFPASGVGTYTGAGVQYWSHDFLPDFRAAACDPPCDALTVEVTEFGTAIGEYVRGTFSGTLDYYNANQQLIGPMPVNGEFAIKR